MIYIFLCVLMNVSIFLCFRLFKTFGLNTFQAIVVNYVVCVVTGLLFIGDMSFVSELSLGHTWVIIAMVLGGVFISTFYLMALTTQKFSMTVSSIASKMSLVIPVLISLFFLGIQSKEYTVWNFLGMAIAVLAIFFSSYKENKFATHQISGAALFLPLLVFILGGFIDSSINYTSYKYLNPTLEPVFPIIIFSSGAVIGVVTMLVKKQMPKAKTIIGGLVLGVVNYFSIYFLIRSLTAFKNDGALVYPLLNVGIIIFSAMVSVLFFKEKLSRLNVLGLLLALMAIFLISYQEIFLEV